MNYSYEYIPGHCGLYILTKQNRRASAPLDGVHVAARVTDLTTEVQLVQFFVNDSYETVDALYEFPLDSKAAVCGFEAELADRLVIGEVKEKEQARREYDAAIARGDTAMLLEEKKADIFVQRIGNIPPRSRVNIRITYVAELKVESDGAIRFLLPTSVMPRYSPYSSSDERDREDARVGNDPQVLVRVPEPICFPRPWHHCCGRRWYYHSQYRDWCRGGCEVLELPFWHWRWIPKRVVQRAGPCAFSFTLEVEGASDVVNIVSATHSIEWEGEENLKHAHAALWSDTEPMNKDLVVKIYLKEPHEPRAVVEVAPDGSAVAMLSLVPEFDLEPVPTEVIFLIDCSGSMSGTPIKNAARAMQVLLRSLPMNCHFNVWRFGSRFTQLWSDSKRYTEDTLRKASASVSNMAANLGGTELMTPLRSLFREGVKGGKQRQLFVLTDGAVSNTNAVLDLIRKNAKSTRVFTLGIGNNVSHELVDGMARAGGGTAEYVTSGDMSNSAVLDGKLVNQLSQATQPALTNIEVDWGALGGEVPLPSYEASVDKLSSDAAQKMVLEEEEEQQEKPISKFFQTGPAGAHGSLLGHGRKNKKRSPNAVGTGPMNMRDVDREVEAHAQPLGRNSCVYQAPFLPPPIFSGSKFLIYAFFRPGQYPTDKITVSVESPEGPLKLPVEVTKTEAKGKTLHVLAARALIRDLEEGSSQMHYARKRPSVFGRRGAKQPKTTTASALELVPQTPDLERVKREIIRLGVEFGLVSRYTSFIAVQRRNDRSDASAEPLQLPSEAPPRPKYDRGMFASAMTPASGGFGGFGGFGGGGGGGGGRGGGNRLGGGFMPRSSSSASYSAMPFGAMPMAPMSMAADTGGSLPPKPSGGAAPMRGGAGLMRRRGGDRKYFDSADWALGQKTGSKVAKKKVSQSRSGGGAIEKERSELKSSGGRRRRKSSNRSLGSSRGGDESDDLWRSMLSELEEAADMLAAPAPIQVQQLQQQQSAQQADVTSIIMAQKFDGSYDLAKACSLLGVNEAALLQFMSETLISTLPDDSTKKVVIATLAVLFAFSSRYAGSEDQWSLIAKKCRAYLKRTLSASVSDVENLITLVGASM